MSLSGSRITEIEQIAGNKEQELRNEIARLTSTTAELNRVLSLADVRMDEIEQLAGNKEREVQNEIDRLTNTVGELNQAMSLSDVRIDRVEQLASNKQLELRNEIDRLTGTTGELSRVLSVSDGRIAGIEQLAGNKELELRNEIGQLSNKALWSENKIALLDIKSNEATRLAALARGGIMNLSRGERLPHEFYGVDVFDPELDMLPVLASLVEPKTAIDVGANRGSLTAALRNSGFSVDCFEPLPELAEALQKRFSNDPNVKIHALACSDTVGSAELHTVTSTDDDRDDTLFSSLNEHPVFPGLEFSGNVTVPTTTLDHALARKNRLRVGLLKTDTEGHDLAVLRGASRIDAAALLVEFWDKDHVFNAGKVRNTIQDYLDAVDIKKYPYHIVLWRQSGFSEFGLIVGGTDTPPGSWGNILFSPDIRLINSLSEWAKLTYGTACVQGH
ncbi:MAG: FkbM family methyltransferase [Beijerinckiaceae bacterium]